MALYRVFYTRTEEEYADIEAGSTEEAEAYAENNYSDCDWNYVDGSITSDLSEGETEEL